MKSDELEENVYPVLNVLEELDIDPLEFTECVGYVFGPPEGISSGDDTDDENDFSIGELVYSTGRNKLDSGCCRKLVCTGGKEIEIGKS